MTTAPHIPRAGNLVAAITALACCNIALGLIIPLVPLIMEAEGDSAFLIGANMALGQFGAFVMGLALPYLAQKFRGKTMVIAAIIAMLTCMILFSQTKPVWAWFFIRFVTGLGIAALFTLSETWVQAETTQQNRGRILGIYMSVLTSTFGVGSVFISLFGTKGLLPWAFGAACMVLGLVVSVTVKPNESAHGEKASGFVKPILRAPMIFVAIGMTTLFEGIMLSFFTIYAIRHGLTQSAASQLMGFGIIACILFFYPTGQLADRWSRGGTVVLCASTAIICSLLIPAAISSWMIWPVVLLVRAGAFGCYGVGLASIGDTFKGPEMVAASAFVAILWGIGGVIGPPIAGQVIDHLSINTLPYMMATCYVVILAGVIFSGGKIVPARVQA
jgi:MFS family permease